MPECDDLSTCKRVYIGFGLYLSRRAMAPDRKRLELARELQFKRVEENPLHTT